VNRLVVGTVTLNNGAVLTISPNTSVFFANGTSLTVNGTINAQGTSTSPIRFTSATGTTPGLWNYVLVQNGNSIFKYCTFQYASAGLNLNGARAGNRTDIQNCTFQGNTKGINIYWSYAFIKSCELMNNSYGIYCYSTSDVKLVGNTIHNNSSDGIHSFGSNVVQLYGNVIQSNTSYGLYTASSDIIRIGWPYTWEGYNTFRYNGSTEVYANSGSPTVLMASASVHDANGLEVYNTSGNPQIATTNCYWDANGCQYSGSVWFSGSNNSLPSWDGQTRTAGSPLGKVSAPVIPDNIPWFYDPRIPDAEKVKRCKDIIAKNTSMDEAKTALVWLYIILRTDYAEDQLGEKSTFFSYLQGLKKNYVAAPFGGQALRYMIFWKMLERNDATVIELSKEAMKLLTGEEKKWVMADLAHAYARSGQMQEAKGILQALRDQYGKDGKMITLFEQDIAMEEGMLTKGVVTPEENQKSSEPALEMPTAFGLSQNYPNPFNPTTMISYQLPNDAKVTLKVFDILGREVVTLVDGEVVAGTHTTTFDGSRLSSGIYFVRFMAKPQNDIQTITKTMKMLLAK
jgi:parallel beta-helix repeat protein